MGAERWTPRGENWLFATTGAAGRPGQPVLETKTTVNGRSALNLHPVPAGWMELRIVRVRADFLVFARAQGAAEWTLQERFFRPDLPQTVQVGVNAYSGWDLVPELWNDPATFNRTVITDRATDLAAEFDYVRFDRPRVPDALRGGAVVAGENDERAFVESAGAQGFGRIVHQRDLEQRRAERHVHDNDRHDDGLHVLPPGREPRVLCRVDGMEPHLIARLAQGLADDLLTTLLLARTAPVLLPARSALAVSITWGVER